MRRFATTVLAITALLIGGLGLQPASAAGYPPCTITGTAAGETITGTEGNDVICTGGGNDTVIALGGNDIIIVSGPGIDAINSGPGNDNIDATLGTNAIIDSGSGDDIVYGTPGDDDISTGDGADTVDANSGDDLVEGGGGADELTGDEGSDVLSGGDGEDIILGGEGDDQLDGNAGLNTLDGGPGNNTCRLSPVDQTLLCTVTISIGGSEHINFSGRIVDSLGVPVPNVSFSFQRSDTGQSLGYSVAANSLGVFSRLIPKGSYRINFRKLERTPGGVLLSGPKYYWAGYFDVPSGSVDISSDINFDWVLDAPVAPSLREVKVRILDSDGRPAVGAVVSSPINSSFGRVTQGSLSVGGQTWLYGVELPEPDPSYFKTPEGDVVSSVSTDANGEFTLYTYAPSVTVSLRYRDPKTGSLVMNTKVVDSSLSNQSFSVYDNLVVFSGRIVDSLGVPVPNVSFSFQRSDTGQSLGYSVAANSLGVFSRLIPKGSYRINFRKLERTPGGVLLSGPKYYWAGYFDVPSGSVDISSDINFDWVLDAPVAPSLREVKVRILDSDGRPAVGAVVSSPINSSFGRVTQGSLSVGGQTWLYGVELPEPDPSYFKTPEGDVVSSVSTDANGEFTLYTYAPSVTVSLRYLDPKTNVVQRFTKLIYSGAITPQVASFDAQPITHRTAKLQWTYPIEYGPIQLSKFVIQVSTDYGATWADAATADPSKRSIEISELMPGSGYRFRVLAVSNVGNSTPSAGVVVNTPTPIYEAPTNFSASLIKTNSAKISWALLAQQSTVKNYLVDYSLDGVTWIPIKKSESKTTSYLSLSGLRMGTLYRFRIAATNKIEIGEYSYLSFSTLALAPTSPTKLQPSLISSSSFTVDWVSPSSNGGSEITDYVVEINGGGFNWAPVAHSPSNNTSISITGLNPGVKYSVRVKAINSVGASKVSSTLSVTTLTVLPSSPTLSLKSKTATSVVLSWVAPANGGAKISDYKAEYSTDGGTSWLTVSKSASTSTSLTLKNLKTKTSYLFRVSAKNSVGYSAPSGTLAVTTP